MVIKKYLVKNVNEAMSKIRYELGKDAVIISQRRVRKSGIKGIFSGKLLEVTAAIESPSDELKVKEVPTRNLVDEEEDFKKSIESIKKLMESEIVSKQEEPKSNTVNDMILKHNEEVEQERLKEEKGAHKEKSFGNNESLSVESVHKEVAELKEMLSKVVSNTKETVNISEKSTEEIEENDISNQIVKELKELDVDEAFYDEIIKNLKDYSDNTLEIKEILRDIFERDILVTNNSVLNGRIVLVGPTGVGKTTTIAKLAGRLALIEKKKVGLITIDTYRIGAIEQLKTYAEIMNIPFKVVITIKEMQDAIDNMKDCDVVLIDTTGRSSKNTMQISELRAFVEKAEPDCIDMVISATTKNKDIRCILQGYSELKYDNIIITKLDETTVYGSVYNICKHSNKPVNFITVGQNVPDDIKISTKEELTRFILGEETLC